MSNRQARRHRQYHEPKPRVAFVGDNVIAAPSGTMYEATGRTEFPPKEPGKHRWMVTATWVIRGEPTDGTLHMDNENLHYLALGCWDCEMVYEAGKDLPCPAEAAS